MKWQWRQERDCHSDAVLLRDGEKMEWCEGMWQCG